MDLNTSSSSIRLPPWKTSSAPNRAEGKKAYAAYVEKQIALMDIDNCDMFIKGYRLGVKLLLAVLMEYDTPLPQITN